MKTKRLFIIAALALCMSATVQAQNGRLSIGAELGLPMGDFGDGYGVGFGGTLRYELPVGDNLGLTGTAGYLTFSGKDDGPSLGMIPVQLGAKYYFTENQEGFYAAAEIGVHMIQSQTYTFSYVDPFTGQTITTEFESDGSTELSYAPEIGYHLANLDLGLRYQMIATEGSTSSFLGIRIAYVLGEK